MERDSCGSREMEGGGGGGGGGMKELFHTSQQGGLRCNVHVLNER